ncbi:hypothetical protein [Sphingomonas aerophila]|uniref:VanZ-like domain-containing protein n=1 Tax=Sphingomonas aerophila TaxID=1344948 RepID=A0A7W9BAR4_9SPHN|nr:hypothetical protein [Sphingomonas aerophila]MBB5713381.1 hypothetical protein [Sphingomonas aerophila]
MNIPALYASMIQQIGDGTGMADFVLHIHAGMAVLILARLITRRSLSTPIPLLVVVAAEACNEILDRLHYGSWRPADTTADVINTLFWPTVLFIGLRLRRARELDAVRLPREVS